MNQLGHSSSIGDVSIMQMQITTREVLVMVQVINPGSVKG